MASEINLNKGPQETPEMENPSPRIDPRTFTPAMHVVLRKLTQISTSEYTARVGAMIKGNTPPSSPTAESKEVRSLPSKED